MYNKVCVVTGANSGLGYETARALALKGAKVFMVCRNEEKGVRAMKKILATNRQSRLYLVLADLAHMQQVRAAAQEIISYNDPIHVLVNNAGCLLTHYQKTPEGFEQMLAVNFLAPFLLSRLLLPKLAKKEQGIARIVNVSSGAHRRFPLDLNNLNADKSFHAWRSYCTSKLANLIFTIELARRYPGRLIANCADPGVASTGFGGELPLWMRLGAGLMRPFIPSARKAADTQIALCTEPEFEGFSGQYFYKRQSLPISQYALDIARANDLWNLAEAMTDA